MIAAKERTDRKEKVDFFTFSCGYFRFSRWVLRCFQWNGEIRSFVVAERRLMVAVDFNPRKIAGKVSSRSDD